MLKNHMIIMWIIHDVCPFRYDKDVLSPIRVGWRINNDNYDVSVERFFRRKK